MKRLLCLAVAGVLALPAAGEAKGGLDPTFGDGGRAVRATSLDGSSYGPGSKAAESPDGHTYALVRERTVLAFLPDGQVDGGFGAGGAIDAFPPDALVRGPVSIAVDRLGRVLVAASVLPSEPPDPGAESEPSEPVPEAQQAILLSRFTAAGRLDPSFGDGGRLLTRLGLPPPRIPPGSPTGTGTARRARVAVQGIAVDPAGRIVLSGTYLAAYETCPDGRWARPLRVAFLARLADGGALDAGFGRGGVAALREGPVGAPVPDEGGGVYTSVGTPLPCEISRRESAGYLFHLDAAGAPVAGFGDGGWRTIPEDTFLKLLPDGRGGLVLLPQTPQWRNNLSVRRLRADGSWDPRFGRNGVAVPFPYPKGTLNLTDAGIGRGGRIYVTGNWKRKARGHGAKQRFLLFRLDPRGRLDRSYGILRTGFGKGTSALSRYLLIAPSGAPLALGPIKDPLAGSEGLALARYLP